MQFSTRSIVALVLLVTYVGILGCASTYSDLVSGSNLGAQEYRPAVLVPPDKQAQYEQVLSVCRQVAVNRQVTAAQEAQLRTITGAVEGTAQGMAFGMQMGNVFKQAGVDSASINRSAGVGAVAGLISSVGSSFASGAEGGAEETKRILLGCLRTQERAVGYQVLE